MFLDSADIVRTFGPFICFFLTLLLMVTTLILVVACKLFHTNYIFIIFNLDLRRDTYEDYTFPLATVSNDTAHLQGFDLFSLRKYAKHYGK